MTIAQLIIIWYFCALSPLIFYTAYVIVSCVSIDWKFLNGKKLAFSMCILCNSAVTEGTHNIMFIRHSLTLILMRRVMEWVSRKRSWSTEQRVNVMKSVLFIHTFTLWILHGIWKAHLGSLSLDFFSWVPFLCC